MNWLPTFISEEILHALGWTLLHALWQGTLLALLLSAVMFALNKHAANTRYAVAVFAQFSMLAIAIVTFWYVFPSQSTIENSLLSENNIYIDNATWTPAITQANAVEFDSFFEEATFYFESHLPLIVTFWLMGVLVLTLKLLGGLAYIQRLKTYRVSKVETYWQNKVLSLSTQMGIKKVVRLMESAVVHVPMVVGHLKPIILLPVGTITGLSPQQLEAILAHELAHIARQDYLINILQSIVEIIFFYHPGIWWISKNIRQERENCCDDLAIAYNHDSLTFAKALARLQESHWTKPELSMAITGNKTSLKARIERVLHIKDDGTSMKATFKEGFVTALLLIFAIIGFSFTLQQANQDNNIAIENNLENTPLKSESKVEEKKTPEENVSYPENSKKLSFTMADNRYVFVRLDSANKIIELFIEGEKIEPEAYTNYPNVLATIKKTLAQEKRHLERLNEEEDERERELAKLQEQEKLMAIQLNARKKQEKALHEKLIAEELARNELLLKKLEIERQQTILQFKKEQEKIQKGIDAGEVSVEIMQEQLAELEEAQLEFKERELDLLREIEIGLSKDVKQIELQRNQTNGIARVTRVQELRRQESQLRQRAIKDRAKARENVRKRADAERAKYEQFIELISPELVKDELIKSENEHFHFKISENSLEINCVVQDNKLQKKYSRLLKKGLGLELEGRQTFQIHSNKNCN